VASLKLAMYVDAVWIISINISHIVFYLLMWSWSPHVRKNVKILI